MQWEWHRVRRSFRRTRREKISSKLDFWNDALRNCGLRRSDAFTEQGQRGVDEIRQRFDDKVIATTRRNAASLHKAINANWGCSCVELHSGNILLNWHGVRRPQSNSFSLAFPPPSVPQLQHISTDQGWRFVAVCVQETSPVTITSTAPESLPTVQNKNQFLDPDKKRTRFFDLIRPRSPGKATSVLVSQPGTIYFKLSDVVSNQYSAPSGRQSSVAGGRGSTSGPTKPLPRLCPLSQCHGSAQIPQGIIPVPDSDLLEIHFLPHEQQPDSFGGSISLQTLLSGSVSKRIKARSNMTRKERFGIAAALTWGTMHLCDSAWLNESIEDKVIGVTFKEHGGVHNPRIFGHPFLNVIFSGSQVMSDQTVQTKENELMAKQIQNKTLYSLAIRLMELGLDKDFGQLRKEYNEEFSPESGGVSVSDLEIARFFLHSLGRDCGINYQIAVEYCLRFLFAGSPENCFQDVRFRRTYFDLVIAPVQNVYNAIDQYQYQAQGP